jgi:hypothetical protein
MRVFNPLTKWLFECCVNDHEKIKLILPPSIKLSHSLLNISYAPRIN